jgi:MoaA/NifB/PqqE/SkfB family radical SAM enzyme
MKWTYEGLSAVHLELSSKCNAACPGCPRFIKNSPNVHPSIIETNITFEEFKTWFPEEALERIYNWIICGTHGDPLACTDLYKILEYICEHSPGNIQINTNGGLRNPEYFRKIGKLFVDKKLSNVQRGITFSIDGLKHTNHLYRRNVQWDKVWANLMAYVETGAPTTWDYLIFGHNAYQVDKARELAEQYGITFIQKNPFGVDGTAMPVLDKNYKLEYVIEHATNHNYDAYDPAEPDYVADLPAPVTEKGEISCMSFRQGQPPFDERGIIEIYVSATGHVHPCCFVGNKMQGQVYNAEAREMQELQKKLGDANNLHAHSLEEILDGGALDVYSSSWKNKSISQCWVQCGKNYTKQRAIEILFAKD